MKQVFALATTDKPFDPETIVELYDVDKDDVETFTWKGSFAEFAKANEDGYDAEELANITDDLMVKGERWLCGFVGCLSVLRIAKDGEA